MKIGHTDPQTSNSGVMDLLAMANNYYKRTTAVSVADTTNQDFVDWMSTIEKAVTPPLISSTGTFVNDVIVKGPASYDFVIAYEALAIENYGNAVGKQSQGLRIVYPPFNLYSDHPLCIIDHQSVNPKQKEAAIKFQDFLLSADIQKLALTYGFRPADPTIPTFAPGSAFDSADLKKAGISADIGQTFQIPDGNTINNLLLVWKRNFNS
jgi:ABC-type sulfate transport system substrate-binding protein